MNPDIASKCRPASVAIAEPVNRVRGALNRVANWRNLGIAYALANLWFVSSWKEVLFSGMNDYLLFEPRPVWEHLAITANVLVVTLILFVVIKYASDSSRRWVRVCLQAVFLAFGILAFGPLSYEMMNWLSPETQRFLTYVLPGIVMFLIGAVAIGRGEVGLASMVRNLQVLALLMLPFGIIILMNSIATQLFESSDHLLPNKIQLKPSTANASRSSKRVVWIIFDEFDFAARHAAARSTTPLPDIERLRNESFVALNVFAPNRDTLVSIPALVTGVPLSKAVSVAPNDLMLYPEDGTEPFRFRETNNVFSELEAAGHRTAVIGWYHPYPRILEGKVSYAFWEPRVDRRCSNATRFLRCSFGILAQALGATPVVSRVVPGSWRDLPSEYVPEEVDTQRERVAELGEEANRLIAHRDFDLVFLHLSIPHAPYLTRDGVTGEASYFTALQVVNDTVKDFRTRLENANQWDNTLLIISSDHAWRGKGREREQLEFLPEAERHAVIKDERIPFIVRFPGQTAPVTYDSEFNSIVTRDLIIDIFKEKVKGPDDLVSWLNARGQQTGTK